MTTPAARLEALTDTVRAICRSRSVVEYIIGLTSDPKARRMAYRGALAYPHFVILETHLTASEAKAFERDLQAAIMQHPTAYRKYHAAKRDASYRPSLGGANPDAEDQAYSVYMTWK